MLDVENAGYAVSGRWLVRDVSLHARPGEFVAVAGANGSGKSTLLRLLSGEWPAHAGEVRIDGIPLAAHAPGELARLRACLAQIRQSSFPFTAYEVAMMGRLPWQHGWSESAEDHAAVARALDEADAAAFAGRTYPTLSGGEQTRVDLARTLAQEPRLLLLDEPTNHLDVQRQLALMDVCKEHARSGGIVVAVLHDLNLAARHADRMLLLHEGRAVACGAPDAVVTCENMRRYFGLECEVWRHPAGCPWVVPTGCCQSTAASAWNPAECTETTAACAV